MILGIDHFVLTVASIEATSAFYERVLGAETVTFGEGRKAISLGGQKINLHESGREFLPRAARPTPGSGDFCLISSEPIEEFVARLGSLNVAVEVGPVSRTGARGPLRSVYFRDPDGNLVEVSNQL